MRWDWAVKRPQPRLCSPRTRSLSARAGGPLPPPEVKPLDEPPDAAAAVFEPGLAGSVLSEERVDVIWWLEVKSCNMATVGRP